MPRSPDDELGQPRADTGAEDAADPLLRDMAQALEPTARSPAGPGPIETPDPSRPALAAGLLIAGRYRLDRVLGEGGMGEVWAATHAITRRRVAMKFVKGSASMRPEMRQRFLREARASSLVQHPGVVEILDVFELDGGVPVMVMDLLVGETLGARLARNKVLAAGEAATLLLPAMEAVEEAHRIGIVHRDLKPDNIFLKRGDGGKVTVKVLDFGIAKLTATEGDAADTGSITGTGSLMGTPWHMAPEQCYGEKDIDPRADIWAFGVILCVVAGETLAPGARIAVQLDVPAPEATEAPKPPVHGADGESPLADKPNHVPAFVALGIGAAGLVAGTVSGAIAFGYKGPVNAACASSDAAACSSKREAGDVAADVATASFIAGGVALGVGAILFFTSGSKAAAASSMQTWQGPAIQPRVGWGTLGVQGRF
jgi:tRNA A-37 threonylcarbamoyl transferase component Bud32